MSGRSPDEDYEIRHGSTDSSLGSRRDSVASQRQLKKRSKSVSWKSNTDPKAWQKLNEKSRTQTLHDDPKSQIEERPCGCCWSPCLPWLPGCNYALTFLNPMALLNRVIGFCETCCVTSDRKAREKERCMSKAEDGEMPPNAFSSSASLDWMNEIITMTWPHWKSAIEQKLAEAVTPLLKAAMPCSCCQIGFSKLTIGNAAPIIGPLRLIERDHSVVMRIGVDWESDCDIRLFIVCFRVAVTKLRVRGTYVVEMGPLIDEIPVVGGVGMGFVNPPRVDFEFEIGQANHPWVARTVTHAIEQAIAGMMVLPNQMVVPVAAPEQLDRLHPGLMQGWKSADPRGVLRVTLIGATNLKAGDWRFMQESTSDPYVEIRLGTDTWTSSTVKKTVNPTWDHHNNPLGSSHDFLIHDMDQKIFLRVYDRDRYWFKNEFLHQARPLRVGDAIRSAEAVLPLHDEDADSEDETDGPIRHASSSHKERPEIRVQFEWLKMNPSEIEHKKGSRWSVNVMMSVTVNEVIMPKEYVRQMCAPRRRKKASVKNTAFKEGDIVEAQHGDWLRGTIVSLPNKAKKFHKDFYEVHIEGHEGAIFCKRVRAIDAATEEQRKIQVGLQAQLGSMKKMTPLASPLGCCDATKAEIYETKSRVKEIVLNCNNLEMEPEEISKVTGMSINMVRKTLGIAAPPEEFTGTKSIMQDSINRMCKRTKSDTINRMWKRIKSDNDDNEKNLMNFAENDIEDLVELDIKNRLSLNVRTKGQKHYNDGGGKGRKDYVVLTLVDGNLKRMKEFKVDVVETLNEVMQDEREDLHAASIEVMVNNRVRQDEMSMRKLDMEDGSTEWRYAQSFFDENIEMKVTIHLSKLLHCSQEEDEKTVEGSVAMQDPNGDPGTYSGQMVNGKPEGVGKLEYESTVDNADIFLGAFRDGQMETGVCYHEGQPKFTMKHGKWLHNGRDWTIDRAIVNSFPFQAKAPDRRFGDSQGLGNQLDWMNAVLKRMWPHTDRAVFKMLREDVVPLINAHLPFGAVHFGEDSTLGITPIELSDIKVAWAHSGYEKLYDDDSAGVLKEERLEEGEVTFEILWKGDAHITLKTMHDVVSLGVNSLEFSATFALKFHPIMDELPVIGGIVLCFLDNPALKIDFGGLGNVADAPVVSSIVREQIRKAISHALVLPNAITVALAEESKAVDPVTGDPVFLNCMKPIGMLRIKLLRAEGLEGADWHLMTAPTSDPYVVAMLADETYTFPTVFGTCDPVWPEDSVHYFMVYDPAQRVFFDVYDKDHLKPDDFLGGATKRVHEIFDKGYVEAEDEVKFPLRRQDHVYLDDPEPKDEKGTVFASFQWFTLQQETITRDMNCIIVKCQEVTLPVSLKEAALRVKLGGVEKTSPVAKVPVKKIPANAGLVNRLEKACTRMQQDGYSDADVSKVLGWDLQAVKSIKAGKLTICAAEHGRCPHANETEETRVPETPTSTRSCSEAEASHELMRRSQATVHTLHLMGRLFMPASWTQLGEEELVISLVDLNMKTLAETSMKLKVFLDEPEQEVNLTIRGSQKPSKDTEGKDHHLIFAHISARLNTLVKSIGPFGETLEELALSVEDEPSPMSAAGSDESPQQAKSSGQITPGHVHTSHSLVSTSSSSVLRPQVHPPSQEQMRADPFDGGLTPPPPPPPGAQGESPKRRFGISCARRSKEK